MTQRRTFLFLVENRSKAVSFFFIPGYKEWTKEYGYKEMLHIKNSVKKLMSHRFLPGWGKKYFELLLH